MDTHTEDTQPDVIKDTPAPETTDDQPAERYAYTATYSPDDNKLRITGPRFSADEYARVKAAGYRWAGAQQLWVAPMWTPGREDLARELAGQIDDEDTSLTDRAEDRADRFEDYRENRTRDYHQAHAAVAAIADHIPLGQPILVGHHSERRARKDAERIEHGMRRAVKMWDTAEYWQRRAAGALAHAKYKERPDVRARRIKVIEADKRRMERGVAEAIAYRDAFAAVDDENRWKYKEDWTLPTRQERAYYIAGRMSGGPYLAVIRPDGPSGTEFHYSAYDVLAPDDKRYSRCPAMSVDDVIAKLGRWVEQVTARADRWIAHYDNRLVYERAMLTEAGRADLLAPTPRKVSAKAALPLVNYRAPEGLTIQNQYYRGEFIHYPQVEMTQAAYAQIHTDYKSTRVVGNSHRVRTTMQRSALVCVFLTDAKVHPIPAAVTLPERTPPQGARTYPQHTPKAVDPEAATVDALRAAVRTGVQVVSAPQLFPTPRDLAKGMEGLLDIRLGHRVLEPSAGTGVLLGAIGCPMFVDRPAPQQIVAVEINYNLCARLRTDYPLTTVVHDDFLNMRPGVDLGGLFDRIIMNPPFERGADIKHIQHARTFLKPGGRLVAVCADGPGRQETFCASPDCTLYEPLPEGSFADQGTNVRTALVVFDAPR